jgi:HEAT repeat protein
MDILSLIAGAIMALALGILIYTQRGRISMLRSTATRGVATARRHLSRGLDARYRDAVIRLANGWHLAGHLVPLERIAVLPRFYVPPRTYDPLEGDETTAGYDGPLNLLPLTPDWPHAIAPYQVPGLKLENVLRAGDNVALLGLPGSGRTTALALIGLLVARQTDPNQEGGLIRDRRLPLLIRLPDVDLSQGALGPDPDPLDPLLNAAVAQLRGIASAALGSIRKQFAGGGGLILMDSWDELPPQRQMQIVDWLRQLMSHYPGNQFAIAGSPRGYKPLIELGMAPVFLMPWGNAEYNELARLWAEAWPEIAGTAKEPAPTPDTDTMRQAIRGNRSRSPLEATLKLWATFAQDDPGVGQVGWFRAYVERAIGAREMRPALERVAEQWLAATESVGLSVEALTLQVDAARNALARASLSTPDFIFAVTSQSHILNEHAGRRVTFGQPLVGAYLAAEALKAEPFRESLLDESNPLNDLIMPFLAQLTDVTPYVEARLAAPVTINRDGVLALAAWAADADPRAAWRGEVFKRLTQLFLSPSEFPMVRERTMAALVASRDRNVGYIFRTGLQNDDPRIRILSALGIGALGDPELLVTLGEALNDPQPSVETAVALALGGLGTKAALNYMLQLLLSGRETSRRAVAEMLATGNIAGEGYDILREAMAEPDPLTRRSAIYGLQLIFADWVYPMLDTAQKRDDQWLVRNAAATALEAMRHPVEGVPNRPRLPEESDWLVVWLAERDQAIEPGPRAVAQLIRALQEGDELTRQAAAESLGALALVEGVTPLYSALRDTNSAVRDAAYRALGQISHSTGHGLPSVI